MTTPNNKHDEGMKTDILRAIHEGQVQMRPKWHFIAKAAAGIIAGLSVLFVLIYVASMIVFLLRDTGLILVPVFGLSGWLEFFRSLPWVLVLSSVVFLVLLEILVRRYAFAYRQPLLYSVGALLVVVGIGSFVADSSELHPHVRFYSHEHHVSAIDNFYHFFDVDRFYHVFRGQVIESTADGMVIVERDGDLFTVAFNDKTQFPEGRQFSPGDPVVVLGELDDGVVHAIGVRIIKD